MTPAPDLEEPQAQDEGEVTVTKGYALSAYPVATGWQQALRLEEAQEVLT